MDVRVKGVHLVARWKWDCKEEMCSICKNALEACCQTCTMPGDDCPILIGRCTHTFHMHCIEKSCERAGAEAVCPNCRQPWEVQPVTMAVARRAADVSHIATPASTAAATAATAATAVVTRVRTAATLTAHDSVAGKSTHTADECSDDGGGGGDETCNNAAAQHTSVRRAPARVSEEPLHSFEPTASEEPELLQPYVEQPRHVTATRHAASATAAMTTTTTQQQLLQGLPSSSSSWRRSVRTFVWSAVTGACCVSLVYWTLRTRLHDSLIGDAWQRHNDDAVAVGGGDSDAVHVHNEVYDDNSHAAAAGLVVGDVQTPDSATDALLGTFVAPSTYAELQYKLQQHRRHVDEHARVALESHDVLHTELLYRCKAWWNRTIANVQHAVAQEAARRDASTAARIEAALRLRGYEVLYVKPASTTTTTTTTHAS